ncbi:MAG: IclR family transcriptional regulator [Acidobacteria bacterium]|nr:IclR family transcriptional regulator [Acidobacteriota bacterium]
MQRTAKDKKFIPLTDKLFAVLKSFDEHPKAPLTLDQITQSVGLAKTTVHRLLYSIKHLGYIHQDANGNYSLSERFYALSGSSLPYHYLTSIAAPHLSQLVAESGESVHIGILEKGLVLLVAVAQSRHSYRCAGEVGDLYNAHSTAMGKCILANLPKEERDAILAVRGLPQVTRRTFIDPAQLELEFERIRNQGWAVSDGENVEGVTCISAPILDRTGRILAALSLSGPSGRVQPVMENLKHHVRQTTAKLSALLSSLDAPRE